MNLVCIQFVQNDGVMFLVCIICMTLRYTRDRLKILLHDKAYVFYRLGAIIEAHQLSTFTRKGYWFYLNG